MQRIQKLLVIATAVSAAIMCVSLAGCGKVGEKVSTTADYLHDIDAARAKVKEYQVRDKATLFFTFAYPLLFLVVFGLIFSGQDVEQSGRPYISYIAPGCVQYALSS